jgi:hypothetical protein
MKEPIDLESKDVMAYPRLRHTLKRKGIKERKEIARRRLPTILYYALHDEGCLLDIRIVSETYPDIIPEILRASSIINREKIEDGN